MHPRILAQELAAANAFRSRFGRTATLFAFAPGRVNLIGEHTDYNEGFALPIAIDRETIAVAAPASGSRSTLALLDVDVNAHADFSAPQRPVADDPAGRLLGVVAGFQRRGLNVPNLDIMIFSTVPIGAGLASSAALEVCFARLLAEALHDDIEPLELARLCQQAEHEFAGTPCGLMDMHAAVAARDHHAMLIDCRTSDLRQIPADFAALGAEVLVADTGVRHDLADGAYADRRAVCAQAAQILRVPALRDANIELLNVSSLSDEQRRRAAHVIGENARTLVAAEALILGDLRRLGDAMFQSHASLRDRYEVSCPELDVIVDAAHGARGDGVFGARMTGGGFGGCAIVLCAASAVEHVGMALRKAFRRRLQRKRATIFPVKAAGCAAAWSIPALDRPIL